MGVADGEYSTATYRRHVMMPGPQILEQLATRLHTRVYGHMGGVGGTAATAWLLTSIK